MCSIAGFNAFDPKLIERMNAKMQHRGPDDTGFLAESGWALGNNRLAIIDLSPRGHQPMRTRDGRFVIVYNGELYNFQELRDELSGKGVAFHSDSDTEVILESYREWGEEALRKFNGMFAFAILDTHSGELFLARDQFGVKPLYYYSKGSTFAFASEIKALLELPIPRELHDEAVQVYFRLLYVPAPLTALRDIYKLEPGHYLTITKDGTVKNHIYWDFKEEPLLTSRAEAIEGIQMLLKDSVKRQLISDRPVGVFLSGGVDSTIVTGLASEIHPHINTYSVGFEETEEVEKYNSDFLIARETAREFGTTHHEYTLSARDVIDSLERAIYHMDEPISNHVQAVNMLLAEKVHDTATVVLGGDGGDELFGGYERYYYSHLVDRVQKLPKFLWQGFEKFSTPPGVARYMQFFAQKENLVASFLRPSSSESTPKYLDKLYFTSMLSTDFTREFMRVDIKSWLPSESLVRSDKMGMAASIEQRVPFLDPRLVEFADRIPVKWKLGTKGFRVYSRGRHYQGKQILREAMREYIPDSVLSRPKWGWFSPAAKWIRGPMLPLMREVLSPEYNQGTKEMFDFQVLNQMLDDHISKKKYNLTPLWAVLTFQIWYKGVFKK